MPIVYITTSAISTCVLDETGNLLEILSEMDDKLVETVQKFQNDEITVDSKQLKDYLTLHNILSKLDVVNPILKDWRTQRFTKNMESTNMIPDHQAYLKRVRKHALKDTFNKIKINSTRKDELIAQVVHGIDDLQKSINLQANRLSELYGLHFPEMVQLINNPITMAKLISDTPNRTKLSQEILEDVGIPSDKIKLIEAAKNISMGGDLDDLSLKPMQEYAKTLVYTSKRKKELESWIDYQMEEIAPNTTAVCGANVGARLISAMGSLTKLAKTHSSKVQIIGAERALYSALKGKGSPPKHGLIFQIPEIGNAPYRYRGKLARAFASKIVIAARLDEFHGEFLGEKLRLELREFEQKLRNQNPDNEKGEKLE